MVKTIPIGKAIFEVEIGERRWRMAVKSVGQGAINNEVSTIANQQQTSGREGTQQNLGVQQTHQWSHLTRKQRGEMAEAEFLAKAVSLGFCVSKPFGESSRYDLIVDNGRRLLRVQVKSAFQRTRGNSYKIQARGNNGLPYNATEIDFLVAWIVPVDAWYVFPVRQFEKYSQMELFPATRWGRSKFEKFREAWDTVR